MKSNNKILNILYVIEIILFGLIITGILPRQVALYLAIGLATYVSIASLEDGTLFFVRSIPLFLAIPITTDYDNLNPWRILSIILFLKLAHITGLKHFLKIKSFSLPTKLLVALITIATISIISAQDIGVAIKRIIYFINLSLIGIVVYHLMQRNKDFLFRLIKNITIPTVVVTLVGFIQLASTYFIDIYQFMRIWGEGIQLRQFGALWSEIAVSLGNTWLAYYGDQLSLRVFSLFPDSHSFPIFLLLGLPAIFAIALKLNKDQSLIELIRTRMSMHILWVPFIFLAAILSGTRGIWVTSVGVVFIIFLVLFWARRDSVAIFNKNIFKYISLYLLVFFLLFAIAYPIFVSPQFLVGKANTELFGKRIRSIIDFGETSNNQRIEIWKKTLVSIKQRPLLGVGIGNFPVVLDQQIFLSRAGSSAHNLYLHIAATMGIPALILAIWFLWILFKKTYKNFTNENQSIAISIYFAATLIFVPWVLIYSLTDFALFDERAFLLFTIITASVLGYRPVTLNA